MAIYHLSMKPVGRAGGRSATAAAAYRAAEKIHDLSSGEDFDFTRKRGVEHTEIVLPTKAAEQDINWARDRQALWNAAEAAEKRKDARVAREYEVALPAELTKAQRKELVREFAGYLANRYGVAVDIAMHRPHREGDLRNHHAHLLTTTREITATGLGAKTDIELGDRDRAKKGLGTGAAELVLTREHWASLSNAHLQRLGFETRIDHRSLEAQGIEREPTCHKGPAVTGMERRGLETEVGQRLGWERQVAAQRRLESAQELGQLERESQRLQQSILAMSADLASALRQREAQQQRHSAGLGLEEARRAGREQWWAVRQEQLQREKERTLKPSPEKTLESDHSLSPAMTIEDRQQRAAERRLEYDRNRTLEQEKSLDGLAGQEPGPGHAIEPDDELTRKPKDYGLDFEM